MFITGNELPDDLFGSWVANPQKRKKKVKKKKSHCDVPASNPDNLVDPPLG